VFAPEIAYRYIYPKDIAGPTFEILSRLLSTTGAATTLEVNITGIPKDRVLVLGNVTIEGGPGGALVCTALDLRGVTGAGLDFPIKQVTTQLGNSLDQNLIWTGSIFIPGSGEGNNSLRARAFFSAATSTNSLSVGVHGVVIPRGNSAAF